MYATLLVLPGFFPLFSFFISFFFQAEDCIRDIGVTGVQTCALPIFMRQVREVKVEDVLGREPVRMEIDRVGSYVAGEVVLVTGAGGSIGSELCRQIARVGQIGRASCRERV